MRSFGVMVVIGLSLMLLGCAGSPKQNAATEHQHYHVLTPDNADSETPWCVLLPGSSGLTIFEDDGHYFRVADWLNSLGYTAIVADYKPAFRATDHPSGMSRGEKIVWVAERAVRYARTNGGVGHDATGAVIGWSLGGDGVWTLLGDSEAIDALGIEAFAALYPVTDASTPESVNIPVLVLTGAEDDVTPSADVRSYVETIDPEKNMIKLVVFDHARHGFDIESLPEKRVVRLLPLVGPKATFGYNQSAADQARTLLGDFLRKHLTAE